MSNQKDLEDIDALMAQEIIKRLKRPSSQITVAEMELARKYLATRGYSGPSVTEMGKQDNRLDMEGISDETLQEVFRDFKGIS